MNEDILSLSYDLKRLVIVGESDVNALLGDLRLPDPVLLRAIHKSDRVGLARMRDD
jgi:hypothetical protein